MHPMLSFARAVRATAIASAVVLAATVPGAAAGQVDARLLRQADVSATHITFVYAGDVWVVPKEGGVAHRLSSPRGEESFPRFSPDGRRIAFSGNYDGNTDVYVVPAMGGAPERVTHHPLADRVLDWYPDGDSLLLATSMKSGRQRYNQFYRVSADGGLPVRLPPRHAEFGSLSPDGRRLAFTDKSRVFRTWAGYRGGMAADVRIFDLETLESRNVTNHVANDELPMWHEETIYFLSDRGPEVRYNIWAYDVDTDSVRQVTRLDTFDVHFPSLGPAEIVFEAGGSLHLLDLDTEETRTVEVDVVTDRSTLKPRIEGVSELIQGAGISPSGERAVFEARGEVFTVPAEHGPIRNLTRSSGVAERHPTWSPDGRWMAYFSDRSGEYELTIRAADGTGDEERLTTLGPGYRYRPFWSPDGRKLAFIDKAMRVRMHDRDTGETTTVDQGLWMYQGALSSFRVSWSPDSRWLAWARGAENRNGAIFLHDTRSGETQQVTSSFYSDARPAFGTEGDYLFFLTNRNFEPVYSDLQATWVYPNTTHIAAVSLRPDVASPLAPRSDEEEPEDSEDQAEGDGDQGDEDEEPGPVEIAVEGFESRVVVLPPEAGNYSDLWSVEGKVVYRRPPRSGSGTEESPLLLWDLEEREEKTILEDADAVSVSADGARALVRIDDRWEIVEVAPEQEVEDPLRTAELETEVDPAAEWRQIFADVWRFQRDFFYDPNMHGVNWAAMRERYAALLDDAVTRWDVNFVIGELIAELNASHTYRGGGDTESAEERGVGLLGVDWSTDGGAYRIERIVNGAPWDAEVRSPLRRPGVDVEEGDYVLAVNGKPLDVSRDPWSAFDGLAGRTVSLTVNDRPTTDGARELVVETLESETRLRHLEWIEANRQRVEELSAGRVGYVYVPNTALGGQRELVRQFSAQFHKEGLVVDERWNSGGQIPDRFVELLDRPPLVYWAVRDGRDWQWPTVAHFGPKVMLVNGWSGSGGDAFPDYFRKKELGPLVGTRTWGGLIGITGAPPLVDGGGVTVPTFRMYDPDGSWFAEGHGVEPDIRVPEDPAALARGEDPQLERAVEEVLRRLDEAPPVTGDRPPYEDRSRPDSGDGGGE